MDLTDLKLAKTEMTLASVAFTSYGKKTTLLLKFIVPKKYCSLAFPGGKYDFETQVWRWTEPRCSDLLEAYVIDKETASVNFRKMIQSLQIKKKTSVSPITVQAWRGCEGQ